MIALGLIAAVAIVSPAFGVSIRKLVKKEVARQIDKATGPAGTNGLNGTNGANGTARAYANVPVYPDCGGDTPPSPCSFDQDKGITDVTRIGVGQFCVTAPGIDSANVSAIAAVDWYETSGPATGNASAMIVSSVGNDCDNPTDFEVVTERQPSRTVCTNSTCSTTASVAGDAVASDDVGFIILIP